MFEIGKKYEIRMIEDGGVTTFWRVVEKYEYPLLKFKDEEIPSLVMDNEGNFPGMVFSTTGSGEFMAGEIINVTSPNFVSAKLHEVK